MAKDVL